MDKITKNILVAFYVLQVGIACREQVLHVYEQVVERLTPQAVHVQQVVQHVVLKEAQTPRGPTSQVAIASAESNLSALPTAIAAVVEATHPVHPHDGDQRHDKDRVKRHRRLHKFVGPLRYYDNLAISIAAMKPTAGHDLGYVTAPIRLNLYGQA